MAVESAEWASGAWVGRLCSLCGAGQVRAQVAEPASDAGGSEALGGLGPFPGGEGDADAARALVETATDAELFLYPGDRHLFTDSSLPSYDEPAARQAIHRALGFLERITPGGAATG